MRTIIVDDDEKARDQLKELLKVHCRQVTIIGEAGNAGEGAKIILELNPDLVLLDVQMPQESGFDMLSSIGVYDFEVIFITGYDNYAIQAIRCSALDYIQKPIEIPELIDAVVKAQVKIKSSNTARQIENLVDTLTHPGRLENNIALPIAKGHRFINPYDIVYLDTSNNYTTFVMADEEKILVSKGLYKFEEILSEFGFFRCHPSHMVNRKFVDRFHKPVGGYQILLTTGVCIPVTPLYVPLVKAALRLKR